MRNRFDQLGKQIGQQALGPLGTTVSHDEISPDAQHADLRHEPDPAREAERSRLGLLGRLAAVLCLIELYGRAPDEDEVLSCLGKLIAFRQKRARAARKQVQPERFVKPFLWIIAAGRPSAVLDELGCGPAPGWPPGVYFGPSLLRVGIIAASELPRERSTLLVRLMAAGALLPQAIEELSALPADAHERAVAEQILLTLEHALLKKSSRTREEQEFIVKMQNTWEHARAEGLQKGLQKGLQEGLQEGLRRGRAEEAARAVLTVLEARRMEVPEAVRARILAQEDPERLMRWLGRAVSVRSAAEVLDEPS